jgi:glucosamine--fructose-6-phosphate aminotransferase (isomerizing)
MARRPFFLKAELVMADGYLDEISEQPRVLSSLARVFKADHEAELANVRALIAAHAIDKIVLTGMGGSHHSLYPTYIELSRKGSLPVSLWDCSELVQQAPSLIDGGTLLIAVSQSGESAELVRLTETVRRPRISIAVTSSGRNTLAEWADISIPTNAGPERTASTKTYTAGLGSLALISRMLLGTGIDAQVAALQSVAEMVDRSLIALKDLSDSLVRFLGADSPIAFIGRGGNLATASMASLLTNEASKQICAAYSGGQFRHGPIELVREGFRSFVFASPNANQAILDRRLADSIVDLGGRCVWVASEGTRIPQRDSEFVIELPGCDESCQPILNILPIQLMQRPLAIARGFEPAQFLNASKVTIIE